MPQLVLDGALKEPPYRRDVLKIAKSRCKQHGETDQFFC